MQAFHRVKTPRSKNFESKRLPHGKFDEQSMQKIQKLCQSFGISACTYQQTDKISVEIM